MSVQARDVDIGSVYRRTRVSSVEGWRGFSVLVPMPPKELNKVVQQLRSGHQTSREVFCLSCLRSGDLLFWRYLRRDGATRREVAALPQGTSLRRVLPPSWLPRRRVR